MRLGSLGLQQLWITRHKNSETWSGRGGLDPFNIEFIAATLDIS